MLHLMRLVRHQPSCAAYLPADVERVGPRAAAGGAAVSVTAFTFLLWYYGSFWPGVPPVAEGRFTLRQVGEYLQEC